MIQMEALRKTGELQSHHWRAAKWFADLHPRARLRREIAFDCLGLETYGLNAFQVLSVAVSRGAVEPSPKVIGVLRESLNIVAHKARLH